jgi:diguanylate cyclase (GGDEF)-like protein
VVVVFEHLAGLTQRLRDSIGQLQESLRLGERLRSELVRVIETREEEIAGRTVQLKLANESLDRLSRLDALTGVANRRGLAEQLDRAWRSALRDQQPLSVLMVDIDHFKAYNDSYGHQQGDSCIKAVATAILHVAGRANDVVARYGGEEFVVILGTTPLEGALQVGEQVRAAVESMNVPHLAAPGRAVVTVSVGVTSVVPTRGSRPDAALLAADRAMYAAKEQGRNRVGYSSAAHTGVYRALSVPGDPAGRLS